MTNYGNGVITCKFHATVRLGEKDRDLGYFESEEDAENAIDLAEADWEFDLEEARSPSNTIICHDCEGSGTFKGQECNMCVGTGRISG